MASVDPMAGVPPDGISVSEQSLESPAWRLQLDLATGGARSLLTGTGKARLEWADPEGPLHPFQAVRLDGRGASAYRRSRAGVDAAGASLTVESELDGLLIRVAYRVEGLKKMPKTVGVEPDPPRNFRENAGMRRREGEVPPEPPILQVTFELNAFTPGLGLVLALAAPGGIRWRAEGREGMVLARGGARVTVRGEGVAFQPESARAVLEAPRARLVLRAE